MALIPPVNPEFGAASDAAILIGHRDETRLNNKVTLQDGRELLKRTTFQSPGYAEELSYGLLSGKGTFEGFLSPEAAIVSSQMATFIGKNRHSKNLMVGPSGLKIGNEAVFCGTKAENFDVDTTFGGITTAATGFATSESGWLDGFCLHSPHGPTSLGGNETANLVFTNVDPNQYLGLRGFGVTATGAANVFTFRLTDYATDALLCAAIKAGLEAQTIYAGRTVTVTATTARSGTSALSLVLRVEWSGGVNVVNPEAVQGVLHVLTLNGATAAKTIYNTVSVDPTNSTAASVQAAVRALGGEYASVVVTKTGTGGSAVYVFAYPVGAAPANLVQPQGYANGATGGTPITLLQNGTVQSGIAANVFDGDSSTRLTMAAGSCVIYDFGAGNGKIVVGINFNGTDNSPIAGNSVHYALFGSLNGTFSDQVALLNGNNTASLQGNQNLTFANTVAYRAYKLTNNEGASCILNDLQLLVAGPDAQVGVSLTLGGASTVLSPLVTQQGGVSGLTYNIVTASGQDAWVDYGSSSARIEALLSVLSFTGAGATLTVKIDHADDNAGVPGAVTEAVSFDVQTPDSLTQARSQLKRVMATTFKRWRRCRWIFTGTNPQAVFAVAAAA